MNDKTFRVLLIEDSPGDALLVRETLKESLVPSFVLTHVTRLDDGLQKLLQENFDLAVLDLALPDSHGLETFFTVRDHAPEVPVVILTGLVGDGLALRAFQEGAADCLPKTYLFNGELARALHYAIERTRIQQARQGTEAKRRNDDRNTPDMFGSVNEGTAAIAPGMVDITQRKDLAVLQASEVSYRRLFETAQAGILILDADTGRIRDVNPFLIKLLGFSRDEILGQTVGELCPFKDIESNQAMLERLQKDGYVRYEDLPLETRDGRKIAVEFVSNVYQAGDKKVIQCNIRDITERKHAEMVSKQLAAIVESSDNAIIGQGLDSIITSWNATAEKIFGYSAGEMVGSSLMRLIPTERQDEEKQILKAEELQRASSAYARSLIEASLDPLVTISAEGKITDVNEASVQATGIPREQLIGTDFSDYFTEPDGAREGYETVFSEGFVRDYPLAIRHISGRIIDVLYNASVYKDDKGKVLGVFAAARDITERKKMERELSEKARLLDLSNDAIIVHDLDDKISSWNKGAEKLYGWTGEEVIGKNPHSLLQTEFPKPMEEIVAQLDSEGQFSGEVVQITRDGRRVPSLSRWVLDRGTESILTSYTDITERKQAEGKIRKLNAELEQRVVDRTAQLQAANQELEAFSYSVSHDLRAPLRHVLGFVKLLEKSAGPSLSETHLRHLMAISQAAKRMGMLIDDLLAFSHVGRLEMQKTEFALEQLVKETVGELAADTSGRNIAWEIGPLPLVWADRALLRLALLNLISNAVKFTSTRAAARIEIGCVPNGDGSPREIGGADATGQAAEVISRGETEIFIRDNGVGFDPKYTDKLFGVFQRLHDSDEFEGTGIGLANVQRIILRHGGRIWGKGAVDGGATFSFSLPAKG